MSRASGRTFRAGTQRRLSSRAPSDVASRAASWAAIGAPDRASACSRWNASSLALAFVLVCVTIAGARPVAAQRADPGRSPADLAARDRAANTLLSLALPGAGQLRSGQARGWVYLAVEAVAWGAWAERRHRGGQLRDRYRDLAWEMARIRTGPRVDAPFAYYERLTKWTRSGAFDLDGSTPGIQPELDPTTFNGSIWALARDLFLPPGTQPGDGSPAWNQAVDYYRQRAYGPEFLWDWSGQPAAQQEFSDVIEASADRFRQATDILGAVLANHVVSAVDAFLSGRAADAVSSLRVRPRVDGASGWFLTGRIEGLP